MTESDIHAGTGRFAVVQPYLARSIEKTYHINDAIAAGNNPQHTATPLTTTMTETVQGDWGNPAKITQTQYGGEVNGDKWLLQTITENDYASATSTGYDSARYGRLILANTTTVKKNSSGTLLDKKYRRSSFDYNNTTGLLRQERVHYLNDNCNAVSAKSCSEKRPITPDHGLHP